MNVMQSIFCKYFCQNILIFLYNIGYLYIIAMGFCQSICMCELWLCIPGMFFWVAFHCSNCEIQTSSRVTIYKVFAYEWNS